MDFSEWDGSPDHALRIALSFAFAAAIVADYPAGVAALREFQRVHPGPLSDDIWMHCNGLFGV